MSSGYKNMSSWYENMSDLKAADVPRCLTLLR